MESSTSRIDNALKKQEEIKAQISALQAQLLALPDDGAIIVKDPNSPPKRKKPTTLAPATPSPSKSFHKCHHISLSLRTEKKPRIGAKDGNRTGAQPTFQQKYPSSLSTGAVQCTKSADHKIAEVATVPSQFLTKLARVKSRASQSPVPDAMVRTLAFSDKIRPKGPAGTSGLSDDIGLKRDDRLALVEEFERGPYKFTPPSDDPDFLRLEPHSGIRLS